MTLLYELIRFIVSLFTRKDRYNIKRLEDINLSDNFISIKNLTWVDISEIGVISVVKKDISILRVLFIVSEMMAYLYCDLYCTNLFSIFMMLTISTFVFFVLLCSNETFFVVLHTKHAHNIFLKYVNNKEILEMHFQNQNLKKIFSKEKINLSIPNN